jgi:tetratricopeptide (TPR) repeat protein
VAALACACRSDVANTAEQQSALGTIASEARGQLPVSLAVSLPDLSGADRDAQQQMRDAHALLTARTADGTVAAMDLSAAFGDLGRLLMAAEFNDAAEPCFLNALALAPGEWRWGYYLAHLYKRQGNLAKSVEYLERTVAAQPTNVAAIWWLGTVHLELGRQADAEVQFMRALALQPGALSAVYGLGRAALARNDHAKAVEHLERVLAMSERAVAAHYPLGLAYRGLGRMAQAEAHLALRSHMEILPIDPLMHELEGLLHSVTAYQDRGMRAARSGNWEDAAIQLQKAVELSPDNLDARLDLSTALYRTGDAGGAVAQAREALRLAPNDPRAQSLLRNLPEAAR